MYALAATLVAALQIGCSDAGRVSEPPSVAAAPKSALASGGTIRSVEILDACDLKSFDAVFGVGTCIRSDDRTLTDFIGEVSAKGEADAWRFAPGNIEGGSRTDELEEPGTELYRCCIHPVDADDGHGAG
jgi:hypothetical protein